MTSETSPPQSPDPVERLPASRSRKPSRFVVGLGSAGAAASIIALLQATFGAALGNVWVATVGGLFIAGMLISSVVFTYRTMRSQSETIADLAAHIQEAEGRFVAALEKQRDDHTKVLTEYRSAVVLLDRFPQFGEVCRSLRHSTERMSRETTKADLINDLRRPLKGLKEVYEGMTKADCRICIKQHYVAPDESANAFAATLCRDTGDGGDERDAPVRDNTDFSEIVFKDQSYWFCNDLFELSKAPGQYRNSTPDWQSKYASTIVWPIRPTISAQTQPLNGVIGFLCLDSIVPDAFVKDRDVFLGFAFVDVLAMCLDKAIQLDVLSVDSSS